MNQQSARACIHPTLTSNPSASGHAAASSYASPASVANSSQPRGPALARTAVPPFVTVIAAPLGHGDSTRHSTPASNRCGGGCAQGGTYRGADGEICGGEGNWGATAVEVWYPR